MCLVSLKTLKFHSFQSSRRLILLIMDCIPYDDKHLVYEPQFDVQTIKQVLKEIAHEVVMNGISGIQVAKLLTFLDLTNLSHNATTQDIENLCRNAVEPIPLENHHCTAICVYPVRIRDALDTLRRLNRGNLVKIVSVAGGYPSGQTPLKARLLEIEAAISEGAHEIDVVINRSLALQKEWRLLYEELRAMKEICLKAEVCMKTILETTDLVIPEIIYKSAMVAMMAGSNFIKTSTGKDGSKAVFEHGIVMCEAIKNFERLTQKQVGLKPAGGVSSVRDANLWINLVSRLLGTEYLQPHLFRIGASSLLDDIRLQYENK